MNPRQQKILSAVIEEYTQSGLPVGSRCLVERYAPDVSPATVRNDMSILEEEGFLFQPHVSSGRVPTDKGYRFFVETLMEEHEPTREEQIHMQKEILQLRAKNVRMARTTAKLLSALSGNIGMVGRLDREEFYESGLRSLLIESDQNRDELCRLAEALDYIDEKVDILIKDLGKDKTKIYIGDENPIHGISGYSMVVSSYESQSGEPGIVAVIGPKRMRYERNKSLVEYMKKILNTLPSFGIVFVFFF
ncbi:MAG: hypothetical protein IPN70_00245 [Candidatus Moraniibacteriota bacterium]|nr:MAG: hypothetical protein IPN70_00245 [Candidatus Moranbacteria bacterium]